MKDLQPWFAYFDLLRTYISRGYLEVLPFTGEAYITEPALHALACTDAVDDAAEKALRLNKTVRYLHVYAEFLRTSDEGYQEYRKSIDQADRVPTDGEVVKEAQDNMRKKPARVVVDSFALHVVTDTMPHDLRYTILITPRRRWWTAWMRTSDITVIEYGK